MPKGAPSLDRPRNSTIGLICKFLASGRRQRGEGPYPAKMERDYAEMERTFSSSAAIGIPASGGFVAELVFFDLSVKGREPDIEQAGGFRLVAAGMVQYSLYMKFFDAGEIKGG